MSYSYFKNKIIKVFSVLTLGASITFAVGIMCTANAESIFPKSTYLLPTGKDILLAPSSRACGGINWSSNNPSVASVDSFGIVHGVTQGKANITAFNKENHKKSKCCVEVVECDPIRIAFTSSNMAGVNAPFDVKAFTPENVESVRFEIRGKDYSRDIYCDNKSNYENLYLWTQDVKLPRAGTYSINTYAKIQESWKTCPEANTEILVVNEFNKSKSSLFEKRISPEGADFIASCEGFSSSVYKDPENFFTIGYGKRVYPYESFYNNLSKAEGIALFSKTLNQGGYTKNVNKFLIDNSIKFNQQQFDALVSFSYNVGCNWMLSGSDLSKILLGAGGSGTAWYGTVNSDSGLFVRSSPSTSGKKLRALPNKTRVEILSPSKENGNWYRVKTYDGLNGYCFGEYLKIESVNAGEKNLNRVNQNDFINEFSLYHHSCKKCYKGLLARRFHELDIFLYGVYSKLRSEHFSYGNYAIPECAKKVM